VDEHKFIGYCFKGKARIIKDEIISQELIKAWEDKIISRLTKRLLKNLTQDRGRGIILRLNSRIPKALFF